MIWNEVVFVLYFILFNLNLFVIIIFELYNKMKFTTVIALLLSTTSAAKVAPVAKSANDDLWESNKTQFAGKDVTAITAVV